MGQCRSLTDVEAAALLAAFDGTEAVRNRAWVCVGLYLGFRIREIMSLRLGDVVQDGRLREEVTVRAKNMKGRTRSRTVELRHPVPILALETWIAQLMDRGWSRPGAYLFQSRRGGGGPDGRPISTRQANRVIRRATTRIDMRGVVASHSLRKTSARWYLEVIGAHPDEGVRKRAVRYLQVFLGHVSLESTQHYIETEPEVQRAVLGGFPHVECPTL